MKTFDPKNKKDGYGGQDRRDDRSGDSFHREDTGSFNRRDEADSPFAKDKRPRINRPARDDDRRDKPFRPKPYGDRANDRRDDGERRSFNPNFTSDNRLKDSYRDKPSDKEYRGNRDDRPRDDKPWNRDGRPAGPRKPWDRDGGEKPYRRDDRPQGTHKPWNKDSDRKPYQRDGGQQSGERSWNRDDRPREDKPWNRDSRPSGPRKPWDKEGGEKPYRRDDQQSGDKPWSRDSRPQGAHKPWNKDSDRKPYQRDGGQQSGERSWNRDDRPRDDKPWNRDSRPSGPRKPWDRDGGEKPYRRDDQQRRDSSWNRDDRPRRNSPYPGKKSGGRRNDPENYPRFDAPKPVGAIRLNRFIANSGICSRREADDLITAGLVSINGTIVTELGTKVNPEDEVRFNDAVIKGEKKVYILMNKPKGFVTSVEDPHSDKTVMDLVKGACTERVYPVGRLDKNSVGVLLITNDGELTRKLTHPSYDKRKVYQVSIDKPLTEADMTKIAEGITLEDGPIFADEISCVKDDRKEIGIEIHSGRNRIVRRIFESLGYTVQKLDRVYFAGLTKKKLKRGGWRFLSPLEVGRLKSGEYE